MPPIYVNFSFREKSFLFYLSPTQPIFLSPSTSFKLLMMKEENNFDIFAFIRPGKKGCDGAHIKLKISHFHKSSWMLNLFGKGYIKLTPTPLECLSTPDITM